LNGAWVSIELYKALELGYIIVKLHEVWHYDKMEQYVYYKFMWQKQEADGWPAWAVTADQKKQFIEQPGTSRQVEYQHTDNPSTSRVIDTSQFYELGQPEEMHVRRFNTAASTYPLRFRNVETADSLHDLLPAIFDDVMDRLMDGCQENDYVRAELLHPSLQRPVLISSGTSAAVERSIEIRRRPTECSIKRSIVRIKNKDNLCLALAIVVARAPLEHLAKPDDKCLKSTYSHLHQVTSHHAGSNLRRPKN